MFVTLGTSGSTGHTLHPFESQELRLDGSGGAVAGS